MKKIKIGFMPLYIALYDQINTTRRIPCLAYMDRFRKAFKEAGIEVVDADVCRIDSEFKAACENFAKEDIDVLVTYHMAYSPSLESIEAVKKLGKPVIIADSTPTYDFVASASTKDDTGINHGIHGVQDFTNLLKRNKIPYVIETGHIDYSDIAERLIDDIKAAAAARKFLGGLRTAAVGGEFQGMGDFRKTPAELKADFNQVVEAFDLKSFKKYYDAVTEEEIAAEIKADKKYFSIPKKIDPQVWHDETKTGLALAKWLEENKFDAFTVNFLGTGSKGLPKMPFAAICKIIARQGLGYAGEGDTLTAGLVGALGAFFDETTFTEMFCPCWKNDVIFVSHMGEMNINVAVNNKFDKPVLYETGFRWTDAGATVSVGARFQDGPATLINLAPQEDGKYKIIASEVDFIPVDDMNGPYKTEIRGWFAPCMPVADFLEAWSNEGGTHHSALVYGVGAKAIKTFAKFTGIEFVEIV